MSLPISFSSFMFFIILFILTLRCTIIVAHSNEDNQVVNIGAILNVNSRNGKEEKIAMEIAVQDFNNGLNNKHKLVLHVNDSGGDSLQASTAVGALIKEHQAQAIIGMETWQETVLVSKITNQAQVLVLSFATPAITPPLTSLQWPFLLRMANNDSLQMQCLATIISSYGWRKVIAIYEDDSYSTGSLALRLLSDALYEVGSEIEHWSAFPSFAAMASPETVIREELKKLQSKQSRVFIIIRSSLPLLTHLFPQAKQLGLMGRDSVWITTDSITSQFDAVSSTVMLSMQGVIGIKTHFSETSPNFKHFSNKFHKIFHPTYPEEDKFEPGIQAVRAYDSISTMTHAMQNSTYNGTPSTLFQNVLASSFHGLSGEIRFNNGELSSPPVYQIVNVIGKSYVELKFWSLEFGFYDVEDISWRGEGGESKNVLGGKVYWPGGLQRVPQGRVMPSDAKPLKIGVPGRTSFEKFVKVKEGEDPTGFCIEVFKAAVKLLSYDLPHEFVPFYGKYDDLVNQVYFKNFSAVVGDITILANRSKYVEFTQPYAESGLSMVVPLKSEDKAWLFLKPFSKAMWLATGSIFVYTMFVVWFLEHRSNPDFRGPWKNQLSTALWFTFSTLFFAHRERIRSNYTRVVVVVWLFIVFVVTSSYTASLTSMLTVQRLEPTVTDIQELKRSNSMVGCDGDSFVRKYLEQEFHFHPNNIINITSEYDYPDAFKNGRIKAAFLELPYEKVLLSRYCKNYQDTGQIYTFGGLGFVFPKGSPIATDISEAILKLSEDGIITRLERDWFKQPSECSDSEVENANLSLRDFWGLFLVTGAASTIMLVLYITHLLRKFRHHSASPSNGSLWNRIKGVVSYLNKNPFHIPHRSPIRVQPLNGVNKEWISSNGDHLSECVSPGHPEASKTIEIEMPEAYIRRLNTQARLLSLASFPGRDRHVHGFDMDPENDRLPSST